MIKPTLMTMALLSFALALGACDKDKAPAPEQQPAKPTTGEPSGPEAAPDGQDGKDGQGAVSALDPKVEQAVTLANQISAKPEAADSILEDAGLDREAFERMLYEIARDPELSKSYAVAREA